MAGDDLCGSCGEPNPAGSAFCLFCGSYLGWDQPGAGAAGDPSGARKGSATQQSPPPADRGEPAPPPSMASPGPPRPSPVPDRAPPASPAGQQATATCPTCGRENDPELRFCGRCGQLLAAPAAGPQVPASAPTPAPRAKRRWWWRDAAEREARRRYRRSMPPLYRWRRGVGAVALVGLALALFAALQGNPAAWVRDRWYDVTGGGLQAVSGVTAQPVGPAVSGFGVENVTDGAAAEAWATAWSAATPTDDACGGAPGPGRIELVLDQPVRVRGLYVWPGVTGAGERQRQFRPARVDVSIDGTCVTADLEDVRGRQLVKLDTEVPVTSVVVGIGSAYPPDSEPARDLAAIGRIEVLRRPD